MYPIQRLTVTFPCTSRHSFRSIRGTAAELERRGRRAIKLLGEGLSVREVVLLDRLFADAY
jgi:hypothetical protein